MNCVTLNQSVNVLKSGDVLAYPTEAVWGLGCDPYQENAFAKILTLKQRPIEKGVILVAASMAQAAPFLQGLSVEQIQQMQESWQITAQQRATTWLVPLNPAVPTWISGQHDRVAIRVTNHPLVQQLCHAFGGAIVSTSANPAGLNAAKTANDVDKYFPNLAILDGALGMSSEPSRIVDIQTGQVIRA